MERTFDFEKVMQPIWNDGGLAWCESVAAAETAPGETLIPLYYHADEILSVQSADLRTTYDTLFDRYVRLYSATADVVHELAADQRGATRSTTTASTPASEES